MSRVKQDPAVDPDTEWLDHVRPTGLVVSKAILKELGVTPLRQTALDSEAVKLLLAAEGSALADPWAFFRDVLGWPASHVAGTPGGPAWPESLQVSLPEQQTVLAPNWAVKAAEGEGFQLLVQFLPAGVDPDRRGALDGWEASAHQRFERLLRESQVLAGILVSDDSLRLVYAPVAETSGWLSFPLRQLATVAGRPMLAGLKLLLSSGSLFVAPENKRLPALLRQSREAQASVSQELAGQVLGALHELLRGLHAADRARIARLARERPAHLYEGLLTVLMRLVFLLYAEDRDLLPSRTDADSRDLYDRNYSVRLLLAQLADDEVQNLDTMDERVGAWGRLLALFRLVHAGDRSGWIVARGGKLFDPDAFPFLEGRDSSFLPNEVGEVARRAGGVMPHSGDTPRVLPLSDGCVLRLLHGLMTLRGERLSYRTLDVEQIGSVYETVMGFTVQVASGPSLAIRAGKNNRTPVFVDCAMLIKVSADARQRDIKESAGRAQLPAKVATALKAAKDATEIALALADIVDSRGSPDHSATPVGTPILQPTDERRRTGSHYTPRSLTEPIVRQALAPALERLGANATPALILDLKVCDPAMGSGAFLVEACRQLGERLVKAWARPGPKPVIPADEDDELHARRLIAQRCLYGVDKNPMATDLARLSLWLATLAREHEFSFLDHALKTGDSLVGLTRAQIAAVHWDASRPELPLLRPLVRDRLAEAQKGRAEIQAAPDDVTRAIQETRHRAVEQRVEAVRRTGDAVISAFFSSQKPKERETRRSEVESWFAGDRDLWPRIEAAAAKLRQGAHSMRPFHWGIEFPEVFARDNPGFDAIVGNPPFAGKNTILRSNRESILDWLKTIHEGAHGNADYVAHFFRRAWDLLRHGAAFGLIATNTIGQGDTRATSLAAILRSGGQIFRAVRRVPWPGEAAVIVSVVHIVKYGSNLQPTLDERPVPRISAYLVAGDLDDPPRTLIANAGKAFTGSYVLGMGFIFDDDRAGEGVGQPTSLAEMHRLIITNPKNKERVFRFIGGEEVNGDPLQKSNRYVIDFGDLALADVRRDYPDLISIIERKVKPERDANKRDARRKNWWQFAERQKGLVSAIADLPCVLVATQTSPHLAVSLVPTGQVYGHKLVVFTLSGDRGLCLLQSRPHELWVRFTSSTMKDDLVYAPSDCFQTFPFPPGFEVDQTLSDAGKAYLEHRSRMMAKAAVGLTKTYNHFNDPQERSDDIIKLRLLHHEMDQSVLRSYGWDDLASRASPDFLSESTEDDPKYQNRFFWPADFRSEVLTRLLDLNAKRAAAEATAGPTALRAKSGRQKRGFSEQQEVLL